MGVLYIVAWMSIHSSTLEKAFDHSSYYIQAFVCNHTAALLSVSELQTNEYYCYRHPLPLIAVGLIYLTLS